MRIVAHISDLHFGTEDPRVAEGLLEDLAALSPALVAVSGDLTQRARRAQFAAAREFLGRIRSPVLVVPGNHDIPLYDVLRRFVSPLGRYRRLITPNLSPAYVDEELALLGVNTPRSATWKNGRISVGQIESLRDWLCSLPEYLFKVLVAHHPFIPPPDDPSPALVGRGFPAMQAAAACGADLVLAGHLHVGYTGDVRAHHVTLERSILVAQAGTAISRRTRSEPNSYNVVTIQGAGGGVEEGRSEAPELELEPSHGARQPVRATPRVAFNIRAWDGARFTPVKEIEYVKRGEEWEAIP